MMCAYGLDFPVNATYQSHLEDILGFIEVGKSAESIVLDSDIENTPPEQIQDIKVLETVFKGKINRHEEITYNW